jgi:hypothetical protein
MGRLGIPVTKQQQILGMLSSRWNFKSAAVSKTWQGALPLALHGLKMSEVILWTNDAA